MFKAICMTEKAVKCERLQGKETRELPSIPLGIIIAWNFLNITSLHPFLLFLPLDEGDSFRYGYSSVTRPILLTPLSAQTSHLLWSNFRAILIEAFLIIHLHWSLNLPSIVCTVLSILFLNDALFSSLYRVIQHLAIEDLSILRYRILHHCPWTLMFIMYFPHLMFECSANFVLSNIIVTMNGSNNRIRSLENGICFPVVSTVRTLPQYK